MLLRTFAIKKGKSMSDVKLIVQLEYFGDALSNACSQTVPKLFDVNGEQWSKHATHVCAHMCSASDPLRLYESQEIV